jgi:hypothetical protein
VFHGVRWHVLESKSATRLPAKGALPRLPQFMLKNHYFRRVFGLASLWGEARPGV